MKRSRANNTKHGKENNVNDDFLRNRIPSEFATSSHNKYQYHTSSATDMLMAASRALKPLPSIDPTRKPIVTGQAGSSMPTKTVESAHLLEEMTCNDEKIGFNDYASLKKVRIFQIDNAFAYTDSPN